MNSKLSEICDSLDSLAEAITNAWANESTLNSVHGWQHPSLTRHDLANLALNLSKRIKQIAPVDIDVDTLEQLEDIPDKIDALGPNQTITYMFNPSYGPQAITAYIATMQWVTSIIEPLLDWQIMSDNKLLPAALLRRLRSIQTSIDNLEIKKETLEEDIVLIQEAREAAESLPTDLESLKEARNTLNKYNSESAELKGKIDIYYKEATDNSTYINAKKIETDKLVEQCEEAYRITTTKGLAASFDERAKKLTSSMWIWVAGLILALVIGSAIGANRLSILSSALNDATPSWGIICMHITLSIMSIGAPLWLAWLATKQIGQRFRLSEDYSFKASVAKAYEGYRREAARIDPAFEARLFSSALSRLEEAPLRLVEEDSHGSPWHEMFKSKVVQDNLSIATDIKNKFIGVNGNINKNEERNGVEKNE